VVNHVISCADKKAGVIATKKGENVEAPLGFIGGFAVAVGIAHLLVKRIQFFVMCAGGAKKWFCPDFSWNISK